MIDKTLAITFVTSGGLFARLLCQALTLILVARALGPQDYGIFIAIIGVNMLFAPLSGLGFDTIALRETAAHPNSAGSGFYIGLKAIILSAPLWLIVTLLLAVYFLQVTLPIWLLVLVSVSDLFFVRIIELAAKVYQGQARMTDVSLLRLIVPVARLALAVWFSLSPNLHSLEDWAMLYFLSTICGLVLAGGYLMVKREWRVTRTAVERAHIKDGLFFATGIVATRRRHRH